MQSKFEKMERVVNLYSDDVYEVCFYFTKDEVAAKELLKNVFVEFYKKMDWLEEQRGLDLNSKLKSELTFSYLIVLIRSLYKKGK